MPAASKKARLFRQYHLNKSFFRKIFEGESLIKTQHTTLLQVVSEFKIHSKLHFKSIIDPDDTYQSLVLSIESVKGKLRLRVRIQGSPWGNLKEYQQAQVYYVFLCYTYFSSHSELSKFMDTFMLHVPMLRDKCKVQPSLVWAGRKRKEQWLKGGLYWHGKYHVPILDRGIFAPVVIEMWSLGWGIGCNFMIDN